MPVATPARIRPVSTAITPTALDSSTTGWTKPGSSPSARPSSRSPRAGCSPRTAFDIDLEQDSVTCPPGTPRRSAAAATGPAPPASARPAPAARCASSAPRPPAGAPSASARHEQQLAAGTAPAARPGLGRRLPRHPTQSGTQDRAPDAPPPRRQARPGPRTDQGRRRLRPARRRRQPRTPGRARRGRHAEPRMGHSGRVHRRRPDKPQKPHQRPVQASQSPRNNHSVSPTIGPALRAQMPHPPQMTDHRDPRSTPAT